MPDGGKEFRLRDHPAYVVVLLILTLLFLPVLGAILTNIVNGLALFALWLGFFVLVLYDQSREVDAIEGGKGFYASVSDMVRLTFGLSLPPLPELPPIPDVSELEVYIYIAAINTVVVAVLAFLDSLGVIYLSAVGDVGLTAVFFLAAVGAITFWIGAAIQYVWYHEGSVALGIPTPNLGGGELFGIRSAAVVVVLFLVLTTNVVVLDGDTVPAIQEVGQGTNPLSADSDGDGLKDGQEVAMGADPNEEDTDDDGLRDGKEHELGTNPTVADTDGDGVDDGQEVERGTDPTDVDTDNDGVDDAREIEAGTNATLADTDGDGLDDGAELDGPTDPTTADTDGDGLDDGREAALGTDPTAADTDGDGLDDGREVEVGTDPTVKDTDRDGFDDKREVNGPTNPTNPDTDGDGLTDGREIELGTDPTTADTDADQLGDGHELAIGTDPLGEDTDGDGFKDGWEVKETDTLPDADPLEKDVYVEIDWEPGCDVPRQQLDRVENTFANAPVANHGKNGIDLHLIYSGEIESPSFSTMDYLGEGYHYAAFVENIDGILVGEARTGVFHVQCQNTVREQGSIFMHELGHSLGLTDNVYRGIDSFDIPFSAYPSVMNYNSPRSHYGLSDGDEGRRDFDDWRYIEDHMFTPGRIELRGKSINSTNG